MSVAILAVVAILISPFVIPVVLTVALCVFLWNPKALTNILPSPPPVPSWLIPAPLKVSGGDPTALHLIFVLAPCCTVVLMSSF